MKTLERLVDAIEAVARAAVLGLTLLVLLVMLAQVFFRYVLNSSLQWSEELAVWGMVWMVFVGSVLLVRRSEHDSTGYGPSCGSKPTAASTASASAACSR